MHISQVNWQAVRAFHRAYEPVARNRNDARAADALFDGGEWSEHAHDQRAHDEYNDCAARVADRYGIALPAFFDMLNIYWDHAFDCWMKAQQR